MSKWKRVNGQLSVGYFIPQVNTQLKVSGGRFIYGDYGVCGTLSRYFGEYIVGLYGMYTDGETNAGFHFSIPLPGKKRSRHAVRVMLRIISLFNMTCVVGMNLLAVLWG